MATYLSIYLSNSICPFQLFDLWDVGGTSWTFTANLIKLYLQAGLWPTQLLISRLTSSLSNSLENFI